MRDADYDKLAKMMEKPQPESWSVVAGGGGGTVTNTGGWVTTTTSSTPATYYTANSISQ